MIDSECLVSPRFPPSVLADSGSKGLSHPVFAGTPSDVLYIKAMHSDVQTSGVKK